jgi:hypothetical protein
VVVSNGAGTATSHSATLSVFSANDLPAATITSPADGSLYVAGISISFSGTGTDIEDGELPGSSFRWQIDFHHATHVHDQPPVTGIKSGTYNVPNEGETSDDVWYRIKLTVMDSDGLTSTDSVDVLPRKSTLSFVTDPPGLPIELDGQPFDTPGSVVSVEGMLRTIEAVSPQAVDGDEYTFSFWSIEGAALQTIATPAEDSTYTATFSRVTGVSTSDRLGDLQIYPNPANGDNVVIKIQSRAVGEGTIQMMDVLSRRTLKQSISLVHGENSIEIPVSELSRGMHIVMVEAGGWKGSGKLFVK